MNGNPINSISDLFKRFPGIGPRQAKRFVYFLLSQDPAYLKELATQIGDLNSLTRQCESCFRFYYQKAAGSTDILCNICANTEREAGELMIVEKDVDLEAIEKAGAYKGLYFVLGGTLPILEKNPEEKIRIRELLNTASERGSKSVLKEVIVALSATSEGDNTAEYVEDKLKPLQEKYQFNLSVLGRGLSTGSEIEYSDPDTIKNALKNRK